ncbi:MAG: LicD family protein [Acholeplasmatales bacterium]|nr:LicD family protein [Acholeplasmatales bacterium]
MEENLKGETNSPKEKSLIKNALWFLINNVLNIAFPFASGIYVARVLLPTSIGLFSSAQNLVQYFVILAFLGIPTYGMREIAKKKKNKSDLNKTFTELFLINLISTCFFSIVYFTVIFATPHYRENMALYSITGGLVILNALNFSWLYDGLEEFRFTSIRNLIFKVIVFVLLIVFVKSDADLLSYAAITVTGTAGNYILNCFWAKKFVKFSFEGISFKKHIKPIMYLVVVNLAIEIYTLVDVTMLEFFSTEEHIAFYKYGSTIGKILLQIMSTFTMVLVPRVSYLYKEKKYEEFNHLLTMTFKLILMLSIPMVIGIQFVSVYLICKIYGDVYINSAYVLNIISATIIISPIGYLLGSRTLLVSDNEKKMLIPVGIGAIINLVGNFILIPLLTEYGAAIASVISEIAVMIIYVFLGKKYFKLEKWFYDLIKIIISACVMTGVILIIYFFVNDALLKCILEIVCAIITYFLLLLLLKEDIICFIMKKIFCKMQKKEEEKMEEQELSLTEIQMSSFEVLKKIKEICDSEKINYWLSYGTLLGAIRHSGFIPWDDDIDIQMPREDYEKFVNYCLENKDRLKPFELFHYKTSKKYIYPIARFSDSRYRNEYFNDKDYGLGVFVDIYPMDECDEESKKLHKKRNYYKPLICICGCKKYNFKGGFLKKLLKIAFYPIYKCTNLNRVIRKYDNYFKNKKFGDRNFDCFMWDTKHHNFKKDDFKNIIQKDFCGTQFNIPENYDYILNKTYGNYMQLPPEEERIAHHFYKVYKKKDDGDLTNN